MKDVISRVTFGFIMAQLFPGAIAVFAISFAYSAVYSEQPNSVLLTADGILRAWAGSTPAHQLFLLGLCIGVGMLIHGLHWATLGALEFQFNGSAFNAPWHGGRIVWQTLLGPLTIGREISRLFVRGKHIRQVSIEDNATQMHHDVMGQFEFVQDFYLYPAQFFAHTGYAFLVVFTSVFTFIVAKGLTPRRMVLEVLAYVMAGLFFVLGRVQLRTLFYAEKQLREMSVTLAGLPRESCSIPECISTSAPRA